MGLDMYIERNKKANRARLDELCLKECEIDREFKEKHPDFFKDSDYSKPFPEDFGDRYDRLEKEREGIKPQSIAYWRKFNALHGYIVDNFGGGIDECQEIVLDKAAVEQILATLKTAAETRDTSLLPCRSGFFFGSTDYDEDYWDDVENAAKTFEEILGTCFGEDSGECDLYYQASW